jgi:phytoene dehydrogenase-like protein
MAEHRTVVVGGGISGLVCALELERAGHEVVLFEREDEVGGRVRTSVVNGYTLDRGFQVLFTAYPTLRSYLDLDALDLRYFLPAARIVTPAAGGATRQSLIGDVLQSPALFLDTITSGTPRSRTSCACSPCASSPRRSARTTASRRASSG